MDHLSTREWRIEPIAAHHRRESFTCGEADLDEFLRTRARKHREQNISSTFVAVPIDGPVVGGYYTLAERMLEFDDMPPALVRRLPRHPLPAILLGRLAVDLAHQGKGLGRLLLVDALRTCVKAADLLGVFAVILDAKNERVKGWYERHGFSALPSKPLQLFIPISAVRARIDPNTL
jgi:GNAT superfamily N-acetyltransferase